MEYEMYKSHVYLVRKSKKKSDKKFPIMPQNLITNDVKNAFLITIHIWGSSIPVKFIVRRDEKTLDVITRALKVYARQGRLPALGSDIESFILLREYDDNGVLESSDEIGKSGVTIFRLCKKQDNPRRSTGAARSAIDRKFNGAHFFSWLQIFACGAELLKNLRNG